MIKDLNTTQYERIETWKISRGQFIKTLGIASLGTSFFVSSCLTENKEPQEITPLMTNLQAKTIIAVQNHLFPNDGNGPSALTINAFPYLLWFLQDKRIDSRERKYFVTGANWIENAAKTDYSNSFIHLSKVEQSALIQQLATQRKTKTWLSKHLTLIFEALLSDPYYGGNTNNTGWEWLAHNPGTPRPTPPITYPRIFAKVKLSE